MISSEPSYVDRVRSIRDEGRPISWGRRSFFFHRWNTKLLYRSTVAAHCHCHTLRTTFVFDWEGGKLLSRQNDCDPKCKNIEHCKNVSNDVVGVKDGCRPISHSVGNGLKTALSKHFLVDLIIFGQIE